MSIFKYFTSLSAINLYLRFIINLFVLGLKFNNSFLMAFGETLFVFDHLLSKFKWRFAFCSLLHTCHKIWCSYCALLIIDLFKQKCHKIYNITKTNNYNTQSSSSSSSSKLKTYHINLIINVNVAIANIICKHYL